MTDTQRARGEMEDCDEVQRRGIAADTDPRTGHRV
jgi:hypothetical protein